MWALIGLLAGALAGQALGHEIGAVIGGLAGFFIGVTLTSNRQRGAYRKPDVPIATTTGVAAPTHDAVSERVKRLEERIEALERALAIGHAEVGAAGSATQSVAEPGSSAPVVAGIEAEAPPTVTPVQEASALMVPATPLPSVGVDRPPLSQNPVWAWFTGGNALTRVAVVVLLFGVAFLLRYFAEEFVLTIEVKLAAVALAGIVVLGLGLRLARARQGYGLSLQGAGTGILYLTAYAASRLYGVVPEGVAIMLLVALAALTVFLALRADSQPLAALAIAGGFLAPIVAERHGAPALLFGYFAILNAAIFTLAWWRTWRALNVLGFVFTFALGTLWGARYYAPQYFATVEPFLVLFVAFYIAIVLIDAARAAPPVHSALEGVLVFGVPLIGFALQVALVRDHRYGAAWSAVAMALVYAGLYLAVRRRTATAFVLLAKSFLAVAVVLATLAIPLAFDDHWTGALWAIEAVGVYWMGIAQRSWLARGFAVLVELCAGAAFVWWGTGWAAEPVFANAHFVAAMLIALAGLATAFMGDRAADVLHTEERPLTRLLLAWGAGWWLAAGALEIAGHFGRADAPNATLAWATASVAVALVFSRVIKWRSLALAGIALLPVMAWVALRDFDIERTTMKYYGWLVFPLAWVTQWSVLRDADTWAATTLPANSRSAGARYLRVAHVISVLALTAQVAWEAGEWVGRATPAHTAWVACATAIPAIVYLFLVARWRDATFWPLVPYREAYAIGAASPIAALLSVWFVAANVLSPGDAAPLTYVPLLNPLELTLALALLALLLWGRRFAPLSERMLYAWMGVALFIGLNGVVLRAAHHWGGIPWRFTSLIASKPLQAALTLTWTAIALALMFIATYRRRRALWMTGAALLAVVVGKLFLVDLGALSGLPRVISFLGVGVLLLVVGYLSPLPPAATADPQGEHPGG